MEVEANSVGHDLTRGMAHFSRARRSAGGRPAEVAEAAGGHGVDGQDLGGVPEPGEPTGRAAVRRRSVLDEQAVAEFARELSALGPGAVPGPDAVADPDPDAEPAVDAEADAVASPQS